MGEKGKSGWVAEANPQQPPLGSTILRAMCPDVFIVQKAFRL